MHTLTGPNAYLVPEFSVSPGALPPAENLLGLGIIASMGLVKLVTHLEERYGFRISERDPVPENFSTLK